MHEACDLLGRAADCLLADDAEGAVNCLRDADMPALRDHASRVMSEVSLEVHRVRFVAGAPIRLPSGERVVARRPSACDEAAIFARDGYRCRYCACRVTLPAAQRRMMAAFGPAIRRSRRDRDLHTAFYALTAVLDHLVPHSRGGTNQADNLVTSCQPYNYGKGDWVIEELGLMDPRTRPPRLDNWDGLQRVLHPAPAPARSAGPALAECSTAQQEVQDRWFASLDQKGTGLSARLLACLESLRDLDVTWSVKQCLLVNLVVGNRKLAILGIERSGNIEVPWYIAEHKAAFRNFAETLAGAIGGARFYETARMWRVKIGQRRSRVAELLEAETALRAAFVDLRRVLLHPQAEALATVPRQGFEFDGVSPPP